MQVGLVTRLMHCKGRVDARAVDGLALLVQSPH